MTKIIISILGPGAATSPGFAFWVLVLAGLAAFMLGILATLWITKLPRQPK